MNAQTMQPERRVTRRRFDDRNTADPTPESVFLNVWLSREALRYRELLLTVTAAPRPSAHSGR